MKKIILILCIIFQLVIPVYAEYKPIPESLSEQYKTEIEQIIDEEYPQVIKKIDDEVNYAKSLRDKIKKLTMKLIMQNPCEIKLLKMVLILRMQ